MLLWERASDWTDDPDCTYEIKYDGYRLMAQMCGGSVFLKTKNGADATAWFPEVVSGLSSLASSGTMVLDGEVCILDDLGRSDFDALHRRAKTRGWVPGQPLAVYCVFDVLVVEGKQVTTLQLRERKAMLADILSVRPPSILGITGVVGEGEWLYQKALALKLEGIVRKRLDSVYAPGQRGKEWAKRKVPGATPANRFSKLQRG